MLKEIIKTLAEEQTQLKIARKTGPYEVPRHPEYPDIVLHNKMPEIVKASWRANEKIQRNAIKITAAHNLQHELKGSEYRHNVPDCKKYVYNIEYEALKNNEAQLRASLQTKIS